MLPSLTQLSASPTDLQKYRDLGYGDDEIANAMAKSDASFAGKLSKIRTKFNSDPDATSAFLNSRFFGSTSYSPTKSSDTFTGRVLDRVWKGIQGVANANAREDQQAQLLQTQYNSGELSTPSYLGRSLLNRAGGALSSIGQGVAAATAPASQVIEDVASPVLEYTGVTPFIRDQVQGAMNSEIGKRVVSGAQSFAQNHPVVTGVAGDVASGVIGALDASSLGAVGVARNAIKDGVLGAVKKSADVALHPLDTFSSIRSAFRPSTITDAMKPVGIAKEAIDKGLSEPLVRHIVDQTDETKFLMNKMVTDAEAGSKLLGGSTAPKEIMGNQVLNVAEHVIDSRNTIGKAISNVVKAVGDDVVNVTPALTNMIQSLKDKGAVFSSSSPLKIMSVKGLADSEVPVIQKMLDVFEVSPDGRAFMNVNDAHLTRQKIFKELDAANAVLTKGGQSVLEASDTIGNNLRTDLLESIAKKHPQYKTLSTAYAQLVNEPKSFFKALGYNGSLDNISKQQLRAGEVAMRTLGNAASRPREAINSLISVAKEYGYDSKVNIDALIRFADELENIFPITPSRSLKSEVSRGINLSDIPSSLTQAGLFVLDKFRKYSPEERLRILRELLKAKPGDSFIETLDNALPRKEAITLAKSINAISPNDVSVSDALISSQAESSPGLPARNVSKDSIEQQILSKEGQQHQLETRKSYQQGTYDDGKTAQDITPNKNTLSSKKQVTTLTTKDKELIAKLTDRQKKSFASGTTEEKQKAIEFLRLKDDLERNDYIVKNGAHNTPSY